MQNNAIIGAIFFVYLAEIFAVEVIAYWRTRNLSDYSLGGRKLDGFTAASLDRQ